MDINLFKTYVTPKVFLSTMIMNNRYTYLKESYDITNESFEKWKRRTLPNNKLKMMGIPMRRKGSS